jgi:hypothetical protein
MDEYIKTNPVNHKVPIMAGMYECGNEPLGSIKCRKYLD